MVQRKKEIALSSTLCEFLVAIFVDKKIPRKAPLKHHNLMIKRG
jgi:hypothetical protein